MGKLLQLQLVAFTIGVIFSSKSGLCKGEETTTSPEVESDFPCEQYDCAQWYRWGYNESGFYDIRTLNGVTQRVYCDMETDGGGWTVFLSRVNGSVVYQGRTWEEMENPLGNVDQMEYWIGLKAVNLLTTQSTSTQRIRVDVVGCGVPGSANNEAWSEYTDFTVADSAALYRLKYGSFTGTKNLLSGNQNFHSNTVFNTVDKNHVFSPYNCIKSYRATPNWYRACHQANPFGIYWPGCVSPPYAQTITFMLWRGYYYSAKTIAYKMRPMDFRYGNDGAGVKCRRCHSSQLSSSVLGATEKTATFANGTMKIIASEEKIHFSNGATVSVKCKRTGEIVESYTCTNGTWKRVGTGICDDQDVACDQRDCAYWYRRNYTKNGVYEIRTLNGVTQRVYCDMETNGGGWTVILSRYNGKVVYQNRNWEEMENPLGDVDERDYWIGLKAVNLLTKHGDSTQQLRFDVSGCNDRGAGSPTFAEYPNFAIADSASWYRTSFGGRTAGPKDLFSYHNNRYFSTVDMVNVNCVGYGIPGWYGACLHTNVFGEYNRQCVQGYDTQRVVFYYWKGFTYSAKTIQLKIRPMNFLSGNGGSGIKCISNPCYTAKLSQPDGVTEMLVTLADGQHQTTIFGKDNYIPHQGVVMTKCNDTLVSVSVCMNREWKSCTVGSCQVDPKAAPNGTSSVTVAATASSEATTAFPTPTTCNSSELALTSNTSLVMVYNGRKHLTVTLTNSSLVAHSSVVRITNNGTTTNVRVCLDGRWQCGWVDGSPCAVADLKIPCGGRSLEIIQLNRIGWTIIAPDISLFQVESGARATVNCLENCRQTKEPSTKMCINGEWLLTSGECWEQQCNCKYPGGSRYMQYVNKKSEASTLQPALSFAQLYQCCKHCDMNMPCAGFNSQKDDNGTVSCSFVRDAANNAHPMLQRDPLFVYWRRILE